MDGSDMYNKQPSSESLIPAVPLNNGKTALFKRFSESTTRTAPNQTNEEQKNSSEMTPDSIGEENNKTSTDETLTQDVRVLESKIGPIPFERWGRWKTHSIYNNPIDLIDHAVKQNEQVKSKSQSPLKSVSLDSPDSLWFQSFLFKNGGTNETTFTHEDISSTIFPTQNDPQSYNYNPKRKSNYNLPKKNLPSTFSPKPWNDSGRKRYFSEPQTMTNGSAEQSLFRNKPKYQKTTPNDPEAKRKFREARLSLLPFDNQKPKGSTTLFDFQGKQKPFHASQNERRDDQQYKSKQWKTHNHLNHHPQFKHYHPNKSQDIISKIQFPPTLNLQTKPKSFVNLDTQFTQAASNEANKTKSFDEHQNKQNYQSFTTLNSKKKPLLELPFEYQNTDHVGDEPISEIPSSTDESFPAEGIKEEKAPSIKNGDRQTKQNKMITIWIGFFVFLLSWWWIWTSKSDNSWSELMNFVYRNKE